MADNVQLNPGVGGSVIATDDIGAGVQVQRVKIGVGVDGAYADINAANPLPTKEFDGSAATRSSTTQTVDAQIIAANTARKRVSFFNGADQDFLLGEGTTAVTTSDYSYRVPPRGSVAVDDYTGAYHGIFVSSVGSGALLITEIT